MYLVLLTDSFPHANGGGISQTLYNLFHNYPAPIIIMVFPDEIIPEKPGILEAEAITLPAFFFKPRKNRFWNIFHPLLIKANMAMMRRSLRKWKRWKTLNVPGTLYIVSTTVPAKLMVAQAAIETGGKVVPYFMDDWMALNRLSWPGGNLQQLVKTTLTNAPGRLMISRALDTILKERYRLEDLPTLVVHNPSPDTNGLTRNDPATGLIIYAGSVWPMHADGLIAVAKAVHLSNIQGQAPLHLHIYCPEIHWTKYARALEGMGVMYMGYLPYYEVLQKISRGWLLLCTSSFSSAYRAFTASSVQTKLTDYIACGRPVLAIGPEYAASGQWVEDEGCGFWIKTISPETIAQQLNMLARDHKTWETKAGMALEKAQTSFAAEEVQQNLYRFIGEIAQT